MSSAERLPLLAADEPSPVRVVNPGGASSFLLIGDHAGQRVPRRLGDLGISQAELDRHIGWDIGIAELGVRLAGLIDATFIHQVYSRLVIDSNRAPGRIDAIPEMSDGIVIPANRGPSPENRAERETAIQSPYQQAIGEELARRDAGAGPVTVLVSLHSFTPEMAGKARPWQVGVLWDAGNTRFARAVLAELGRDPALTVGDNQPYAMDVIDYTVPRHAYPDRPYLEIEIRQDLLADSAGRQHWAERLAALLAAVGSDGQRWPD